MIVGLRFSANFAVSAGGDWELADDGDGDGEGAGEDPTTVVGGRASDNTLPPGRSSCADARTAHKIRPTLSNSLMNEARLEDSRFRSGGCFSQSLRGYVIILKPFIVKPFIWFWLVDEHAAGVALDFARSYASNIQE
jgi:hypothetical protein